MRSTADPRKERATIKKAAWRTKPWKENAKRPHRLEDGAHILSLHENEDGWMEWYVERAGRVTCYKSPLGGGLWSYQQAVRTAPAVPGKYVPPRYEWVKIREENEFKLPKNRANIHCAIAKTLGLYQGQETQRAQANRAAHE